jgi:hypothetical protein
MIIHTPTIRSEGGQVCVSARFELDTDAIRVPDTLWFRFPDTYRRLTTGRADAFAASLLLLAMVCREDMDVDGVLSPRLVEGMQEYQRLFNFWLPERFRRVSVRGSSYRAPAESGQNVACAFSGGVDSFFTLRTHLRPDGWAPAYRVSHALFVHGYDIALTDERTYRTVSRSYSEMMQQLGLELITGRTNVHDVLSPTVGWEWAHGAALIGVALVLDQGLRKFYVPASHTYADAYPWGSDPRLDHLLSTETLAVLHDGASVSRAQKAAVIAEWPETYDRLRVCWENPDGLNNCGRCRKCIRTMIVLETLGVLSRYRTFSRSLTGGDIRTCRFAHEHERHLAWQVVAHAEALGRRDIASDLRYALLRSRVKSAAGRVAAAVKEARTRLARTWAEHGRTASPF